jgi:hypothetical protein
MSSIYEYMGMAGTEKCFNRNPVLRKISNKNRNMLRGDLIKPKLVEEVLLSDDFNNSLARWPRKPCIISSSTKNNKLITQSSHLVSVKDAAPMVQEEQGKEIDHG